MLHVVQGVGKEHVTNISISGGGLWLNRQAFLAPTKALSWVPDGEDALASLAGAAGAAGEDVIYGQVDEAAERCPWHGPSSACSMPRPSCPADSPHGDASLGSRMPRDDVPGML